MEDHFKDVLQIRIVIWPTSNPERKERAGGNSFEKAWVN